MLIPQWVKTPLLGRTLPWVQLLVWFILQGRLNINDHRRIRWSIPRIDERRRRWSTSFLAVEWKLSMCLPKDPMTCFLSWLDTPLHKANKKVWISFFFFYLLVFIFISCEIWDIQNKMIFQGFVPNWESPFPTEIWAWVVPFLEGLNTSVFSF